MVLETIKTKQPEIHHIHRLSSLVALKEGESKHPYILDILETYTEIVKSQKSLILDGIPSHVGIPGNEIAGKLAKDALKTTTTNIMIPHTDFRNKMKEHIKRKWQAISDSQPNKLYDTQPTIGEWLPDFR